MKVRKQVSRQCNMSHNELVHYIVTHYDSQYLLPLSKQYNVKTWNAAIQEAFKRMTFPEKKRSILLFAPLRKL